MNRGIIPQTHPAWCRILERKRSGPRRHEQRGFTFSAQSKNCAIHCRRHRKDEACAQYREALTLHPPQVDKSELASVAFRYGWRCQLAGAAIGSLLELQGHASSSVNITKPCNYAVFTARSKKGKLPWPTFQKLYCIAPLQWRLLWQFPAQRSPKA